METFAVLWSEQYHSPRAGKLELDSAGLRFEGPHASQRVYYEDIEALHVARDRRERISGRPALVLDLVVGGPLRIASLGGIGILTELTERLGHVTATQLPL